MVTSTEKKKRLNQLEKSIKKQDKPVPREQLIADMIYQYGMERRKAREYLDAMSKTTESDVVDIRIEDSGFGFENHDYNVFMVEEDKVDEYTEEESEQKDGDSVDG